MKILALDTSTEFCSVALLADGRVHVREVLAGQRHSTLLLPLVDETLAECGIELSALDGIAFGSGPGSFTGLRIACSVAQGLAFGAGLPVLGVSTLLSLAEGCGQTRVIACLDARMGEVYHAAYEKHGAVWRETAAPGLFSPQDAPLPQGDGWFGCGSGFTAHGELLRQRYGAQLAGVTADNPPRASDMAHLALPFFERGDGLDAAQAAPLYIRNKVALKTSER